MSDALIMGFAHLASEQWRVLGIMGRLVGRLPAEAQDRAAAQVRFASGKLQSLASDHGFRLEAFDGRAFEAGLPVVALNADDFAGAERLRVAETLEPAVTHDGRVIQLGKVLLEEDVSDVSRD